MTTKNPHIINKTKEAREVSLNTRFPFAINLDATGNDFDKYINEIDIFFTYKESFTWIHLVTAATDFIDVKVDCVTDVADVSYGRTFKMRVGSTIVCRGIRILTGTDITGIFTVGLGS